MGYTSHLWDAFVGELYILHYGSSLPTSASFIQFGCCRRLACRSLKEDVSGRYSFIPSFVLIVLLRNLFFS